MLRFQCLFQANLHIQKVIQRWFQVLHMYVWPGIERNERGPLWLSESNVVCKIAAILSRPRPNGRDFADDVFKCIFLNENVSNKISLKFVTKGPIVNSPALVQIMAWCREAISWTQDVLSGWRIYASLGLNELTFGGRETHIFSSVRISAWISNHKVNEKSRESVISLTHVLQDNIFSRKA